MTNKQESRLSMYLSFRDFQASNTAITNLLPNYNANSTIFVNTIPQIQAVSEQQKISKKGITQNKDQLKETLVIMSADYARKLQAYARFTNNTVLAEEVNFTESKLRQVADTAVKDYAQIVYNKAQTSLTALSAYGITVATQTALSNAITIYNASLGKPRISQNEISQLTRQLKSLFKTADEALANMDSAVEIVRLSQKTFYENYKNARKVIETGTGKLAVKGVVADAHSGEPIKSATLLFTLLDENLTNMPAKSPISLVKKSAEKGGFYIKSLSQGIYVVTVKKVGYADYQIKVPIAYGELIELHFKLLKS